MGLPAFRREFEQAIALLPRSPLPEAIEGSEREAKAEFDRALKTYKENISAWRSEMLLYIPKLEELFSRASRDPDPSVLRYMIDELMPQLTEVLDESIRDMERRLESEGRSLSAEFVSVLPSRAMKTLKAAEKKYRAAISSHRDILLNLRDRLKIVAWNYDPDARGGPSFTNADDLIAHLRA